MKRKIIAFLLCAAFSVGLAGLSACGRNEPEQPDIPPAPTTRPDANSEADYGLNAVASLGATALTGKTLYWLGSSVTYGTASGGVSMADYIAKRNGCTSVKEAVGGTTMLVTEPNRDPHGNVMVDGQTGKPYLSFVERMPDGDFDPAADVDVLLCQISTNDAGKTYSDRWGEITASDVKDKDAFDTATTLGATEYIIAYALATWNCKIVLWSGAWFGENKNPSIPQTSGASYAALIEQMKPLADKWDIEILDLFNDEAFNGIAQKDYKYYMSDPIHPKKAGYLEWWTPAFEKFLYGV